MALTPEETRVLGCLLEKELATPQYYPLTMNALVLACNQSSNRDPVVSYDEREVAGALARLREAALVRVVHAPGQRADKYRHGIEERWGLDAQHRAVLAVLLLRGPQTVGELRARTERMASFGSLREVEEVLELLARREEPLTRLLARAPGQKEARWAQLIGEDTGGQPSASSPSEDGSAAVGERPARFEDGASGSADRQPGPAQGIDTLREEVAELREAVAALQATVDELRTLLD